MSGDRERLTGLRLIENWLVPRGKVFMINDEKLSPLGSPAIVAHPSTMMEVMNGGRPPLWTRHMLGVREAERDKRRRAKHAIKVPPANTNV